MYLPTTRKEMTALGWDALDVILVSGDSYIDSPFIGAAVIGKVLVDAGYRVGIVAQPNVDATTDITRLGEPALFWGVTAGGVDSLVANRTATGKRRRQDDYTPGGENTRRPDRACIVYSNLIRGAFKQTRPIVLGGIEASLRRVAHYDFWTDKIRRSILFDAKADYLLYGMGERAVVALAQALKTGEPPTTIRGLCYVSRERPETGTELPAYAAVAESKEAFADMFETFYHNNDPVTAEQLYQQQDTRYLVQNPPAHGLSSRELDHVYALGYERELHPYYAKSGPVRALDTIRFSIPTHRGCYGECNFCAIAVHEGRTVQSRSRDSILAEARDMVKHPKFKGIISDVGGPTANMYGFECPRKHGKGCCPDKRCLHPSICSGMPIDHTAQVQLLEALRAIEGIRKIHVASGIRYDMVLADKKAGPRYLRQIVHHHVSGQLKLAPEHSESAVLDVMGKPDTDALLRFRRQFQQLTAEIGKKQFLTYYLIAAHPGCTLDDMNHLRRFAEKELKLLPEQIQVFTPTPSTYSTLIYWTGRNPFTGKPCFVEKSQKGKQAQKDALGRTGERGMRNAECGMQPPRKGDTAQQTKRNTRRRASSPKKYRPKK